MPPKCQEYQGSMFKSKNLNGRCPQGYQPYKYATQDTKECCTAKESKFRPTRKRPAQSFSKFMDDSRLVLAYTDTEIARLYPQFDRQSTPQQRLKRIGNITTPYRDFYTKNQPNRYYTQQEWARMSNDAKQYARKFRAGQLQPQQDGQPYAAPRIPRKRGFQQAQSSPTKTKKPRPQQPPRQQRNPMGNPPPQIQLQRPRRSQRRQGNQGRQIVSDAEFERLLQQEGLDPSMFRD